MSKKLTLNIDDELISFAHTYSKETGLSISKLFEQYLNNLKTSDSSTTQLNSKTLSLYGLFEDSPIPDKNDLRKSFHEKSTN